MLVKIISQKDFLVKIGALLVLLMLGRGVKQENATFSSKANIIDTAEVQRPLVLTTANSVSIFPSAGLASGIN